MHGTSNTQISLVTAGVARLRSLPAQRQQAPAYQTFAVNGPYNEPIKSVSKADLQLRRLKVQLASHWKMLRVNYDQNSVTLGLVVKKNPDQYLICF